MSPRRPFDVVPTNISGVLSVLNEMWTKMEDISKTHDEDTDDIKQELNNFKDEMRTELKEVKALVSGFQTKVFGLLVAIVVAVAGRYGLDLSGVMQ